MINYGFILGRESELSKAEIFSVLNKNDEKYNVLLNTKEALIVENIFNEIDINKLGGTIKLFKLLSKDIEPVDLQKFIQKNLEISQDEKRINFGVSGYGNIQSNKIYAIGKKIKDKLIENGAKARFVTGKFKDLSSVIVTENKLLERGFEIIIIENKGKFFVGQTIEVQNYKSYSKRDFGRTARDDKSGMLPPKLAQILINLGRKDNSAILYDPFCGSGTVLQEAILMGFENVYGSDISAKAVEDTKENLKWLLSRHSEFTSEPKKLEILKRVQDDVFVSDILTPSRQIPADLIVGEGFLGEPIRRNLAEAKNDAKNLADFYLKAFTSMERALNSKGRIVIAIPYFIVGREKAFLPVLEKLELAGLKQAILPNVNFTPRNTLLYSRPDSFVGRELFILEKK